jgi:hypothetical protein
MKRLSKMLFALAVASVAGGCATTIDYPYYHYRGYMGPDGIDYHYSNHY